MKKPSTHLVLRITPELRREIGKAVKRTGLTTSQVVRACISRCVADLRVVSVKGSE